MSQQSGGTAYYSNGDVQLGTVDLNPADNTSGNNMWTGNYILARVNHGDIQMLTPQQYTNLVNAGIDVDIIKDHRGST
jgi:hypothetical protein